MEDFPPISSDQHLLRTILDKSWIVDGEIHRVAFQPRKDDATGLSLFFNKQEAGNRFTRPIFGFLNVHTGSVRDIQNDGCNLDIIQDEESHASIIGIPNFHLLPKEDPKRNEMKKKANFLASEIAEKASKIDEYISEGFSPKDLL